MHNGFNLLLMPEFFFLLMLFLLLLLPYIFCLSTFSGDSKKIAF